MAQTFLMDGDFEGYLSDDEIDSLIPEPCKVCNHRCDASRVDYCCDYKRYYKKCGDCDEC